jgi:aldose sugar dehydrogenase
VAAWAQVNVGEQKPEASLPFTMTTVATFKLPWRLAFLPDGRMLITEKVGPVWLVSQQGEKIQVGNTPPVYWQGQNGMHGVFLSPITPPTTVSISPMPSRVTMAEAWRWRAPS